MPQMSPMWWTMLFILFLICYMMMCMINYFSTQNKMLMINKKLNMMNNSMNWKW